MYRTQQSTIDQRIDWKPRLVRANEVSAYGLTLLVIFVFARYRRTKPVYKVQSMEKKSLRKFQSYS